MILAAAPRRALFGALTVLGTVAAAELLARGVERPRVIGTMTFPASNDAYRLHRPASGALGYELVPGVAFGDVRINSLGLRDVERPAEKAAGTFRVLVLGDSLTLGAGMPLEQTYPKVLERALAEARDPSSAGTLEVWNAGVIGYNASQEAAWLELHGLALEPDLVVVGFCLNDFGAAEKQVLEGDHWRVSFVAPALVPMALGDGPGLRLAARESALVRLGLRAIDVARGSGAKNGGGQTPVLDLLDQANEGAYRNIRDLAGGIGARTAIVVLPYLAPAPVDLELAGRRIVDLAAHLDVPVLDLRGGFPDSSLEALRIHPDDPWHPGPEGHRLIGQAVARFLLAQHLLPASNP